MLVRRADDAFAAMQQPDYRRPHTGDGHRASDVSDLYYEACESGDRRSCWVSLALQHSMRALAAVKDHCVAGDQMSCRALPLMADRHLAESLPGRVGRSQCDGSACSETLLRQECQTGFPMSCLLIPPADAPEAALLRDRALMLAREGCRAGLPDECMILGIGTQTEADRSFAWHQACRWAMRSCADPRFAGTSEARDLMEYSCQYATGNEYDCAEVLSGYVEKKFPEPESGRALTIATWLCRKAGAATEACIRKRMAEPSLDVEP